MVGLWIRQNLSNIKSVLRKKTRKRGRPKNVEQAAPVQAVSVDVKPIKVAAKGLEALEEQVDDCLTFARNLDKEGLADVIRMLRKARNEVVWKLGQ